MGEIKGAGWCFIMVGNPTEFPKIHLSSLLSGETFLDFPPIWMVEIMDLDAPCLVVLMRLLPCPSLPIPCGNHPHSPRSCVPSVSFSRVSMVDLIPSFVLLVLPNLPNFSPEVFLGIFPWDLPHWVWRPRDPAPLSFLIP